MLTVGKKISPFFLRVKNKAIGQGRNRESNISMSRLMGMTEILFGKRLANGYQESDSSTDFQLHDKSHIGN